MRRCTGAIVVAVVVLSGIAGCSSGTATKTASTPVGTTSAHRTPRSPSAPSYTWSNTPNTTPYIAVQPNPKASYTSSCDYLLGDFSSNTSHGFRFISSATIHNTGNIGVVAKITATWYPVGLSPVTHTNTRKIPTGHTVRANFVIPISSDTLDAYQANNDQASSCKVKVALVNTFGQPK